MENSPLRFLDYDISLMLADQVLISQEEEARRFHSNNFENSHEIDLNQGHHYFISMAFEEIGYLLGGPLLPYSRIEGNSKIKISDFKRCYDVCTESGIIVRTAIQLLQGPDIIIE